MSSFLFMIWTLLSLYQSTLADEAQSETIDTFYDDSLQQNWEVLSTIMTDEFSADWDDNNKWDEISEHIETDNNNVISRKCQNVFGHSLCLCAFTSWDDNNYLLDQDKYNCHQQGQQKQHLMLQRAHKYKRFAAIPGKNNPFPQQYFRSRAQYQQQPQQQQQQPLTYQQEEEIIEEEVEENMAAALDQDIDSVIDSDIDSVLDSDINNIDEAEIENEEDNLLDEMSELMQEEEQLNEELESNLENEVYKEQILQNEIDSLTNNGDDDELIDELDVVHQEVETQSEIISAQSELIQDLKQENAYQEEIIDIMEEEENDGEDQQEEEDELDELNNDLIDNENDEYDDIDDDIDDDVIINEDINTYNDDVDDFVDEDYDELYDVNGNGDVDDNSQYFESNLNELEYDNLEKEEADELIADTFWGLEVYSLAFGLLCCCCIICYLHKSKCCGLLKDDYNDTFGGYSNNNNMNNSNGYVRYGRSNHHKKGFKKVFADVKDNYNDVEMGLDDQDLSDQAEMLRD